MPVILFAQYFKWHWFEMPVEILKGWKNIFLFAVNYFSLPLLLKTLFAPWRRIAWQSAKGFHFGAFFESLVGNLFSRFLGLLIRLGIVALGILGIGLVALGGMVALFIWLLLPFIIAFSFSYGFSIFF